MKKVILLFLIAISNANAQDLPSNYLSIEADPAPFVLGGYSFSLKLSPEKLNHFSIMASIYSSELPDKMISKTNYNRGFRDIKLETSYALFFDYYLKGDRTGFYFGPSAFMYSKSVGMKNNPVRTDFNSIYPNFRIGYVYKPFEKSGFYINPWFNFGKEYMLNDNNNIEGLEYSANNISYIVAIHFGYRVTF